MIAAMQLLNTCWCLKGLSIKVLRYLNKKWHLFNNFDIQNKVQNV